MKEQQFEQQVQQLRNHHRNIQFQIQEQIRFVQSADKIQALQRANLISTLTYALFNYCQKLLHVSQDQSSKCYFIKQKLMKTFDKNKLSTEKMRLYEQKLEEAQRKIESLLAQKSELELVNRNLKAELKLSGVITSFTFNDKESPNIEHQFNNAESSISGPHEESACYTASQVDKVQLYVSLLSELNNDLSHIDLEQNKRQVEYQQEILKSLRTNQYKSVCAKETSKSFTKVQQNENIQI